MSRPAIQGPQVCDPEYEQLSSMQFYRKNQVPYIGGKELPAHGSQRSLLVLMMSAWSQPQSRGNSNWGSVSKGSKDISWD